MNAAVGAVAISSGTQKRCPTTQNTYLSSAISSNTSNFFSGITILGLATCDKVALLTCPADENVIAALVELGAETSAQLFEVEVVEW
jgi:hypothetical protein